MGDPHPASYALSFYGVNLSAIGDIQLLENATSLNNKKLLDLKDVVASQRMNFRQGDCMTIVDAMNMIEDAKKEGINFILEHLTKVGDATSVTKVFWDWCRDSDALLAHFAIKVAGAIDGQLVENATIHRTERGSNRRVLGLMTAVRKRLDLPDVKMTTLEEDKNGMCVAMKKKAWIILSRKWPRPETSTMG
jgi:hypothetical protein